MGVVVELGLVLLNISYILKKEALSQQGIQIIHPTNQPYNVLMMESKMYNNKGKLDVFL